MNVIEEGEDDVFDTSSTCCHDRGVAIHPELGFAAKFFERLSEEEAGE